MGEKKENGLETQSEQELIDSFYVWFGTRQLVYSSREPKGVWMVEPTKEEKKQADQIKAKINERERQYIEQGVPGVMAQSMAFLNDPDAGPLFAMLSRKNIEIIEREKSILGFDSRRDLPEDKKKEIDTIDSILKPIIDKVLGEIEITVDDYDPKQYPQLVGSDIQSEQNIANNVWHFLIQHFSRGHILQLMMPQILSLSREEQEKFISIYEEEVFKAGGFQGNGFKEKLAEMYPEQETK